VPVVERHSQAGFADSVDHPPVCRRRDGLLDKGSLHPVDSDLGGGDGGCHYGDSVYEVDVFGAQVSGGEGKAAIVLSAGPTHRGNWE
jgi:hypothetical protein